MYSISQLPLKTQIIIHINYRDIFNSPVHIDELMVWLDLKNVKRRKEFYAAIEELEKEKLILTEKDYIALANKKEIIQERIEKKKLNAQIIKSSGPYIRLFSKIPFLKYIGISGSVAADNPTIDKEGIKKGKVDLDLFLIIASDSLWITYFIIKIINSFITILKLKKHYLCFNYAMDETYLEIHNKNFFTATELVNLKSIYNDLKPTLINNNLWIKRYYPGMKNEPRISRVRKTLFIVKWLNFISFSIFQFLRIFKRRNFHPILEIRKDFNIGQRHNLRRVCQPNGGYQELIKEKFTNSYQMNFREYFDKEIIEFLFSKESFAIAITKSEVYYKDEVFSKFKRYARAE